MTTEQIIQLRGHHLSLFADYYFRNHKQIQDGPESHYSTQRYGAHMKRKMDLLWRTLLSRPNSHVKIVRGLDSLCKNCPIYDEKICRDEEDSEDKFTLDEYELLSGETYSSADLISRFEGYKARSGYLNPRDRLLALLPETHSLDYEISDSEIDQYLNKGGKQ